MTIRDGDWELMTYDARTGRSVWRCFDGAATHYRTDYPVDGILRDNRSDFNESGRKRFGDGQRVASIPLNIFYQQLHEAQCQDDDAYVSRWLNDPDNRAFRTFKGTV